MLRLAVATTGETGERISDPLAERGIAVVSLASRERILPLTGAAREAVVAEELAGVDLGFVYPPRLIEGGALSAIDPMPWVNGRRAVATSRNKAAVLARLDRAGLPAPETVLVSNPVDEAGLRAVWERFDPPVVVKPTSTTRGVGIARADDLDTFLGIVDYLRLVHGFGATRDRSFLVQPFLPDARDLRLMVIDGEYVGGVERRLPRDARDAGRWKHNVHRGATAVAADPPREQRNLAEQTAALLGIDYLGVDLLVSDGQAVVSETNARPTVDEAAKYEPDFYDRLAALVRSRVNQ